MRKIDGFHSFAPNEHAHDSQREDRCRRTNQQDGDGNKKPPQNITRLNAPISKHPRTKKCPICMESRTTPSRRPSPKVPNVPKNPTIPPRPFLLLHQRPPGDILPRLLVRPRFPRPRPRPPVPRNLAQVLPPAVGRRGAVADQIGKGARGRDARFSHCARRMVPAGGWGGGC